jgi:hypothetical protein
MRRLWLVARLLVVALLSPLFFYLPLPAWWVERATAALTDDGSNRSQVATSSAAGLAMLPPQLAYGRGNATDVEEGCSHGAHSAAMALRLARVPVFPVRCRSDLHSLVKQLPSPVHTHAIVLVEPDAEAQSGRVDHVPHLVRNMFGDEMLWLPAGTQKLPLSHSAVSASHQVSWVHFDGRIHGGPQLAAALERMYTALTPGGVLSGSNFLDHGSTRHPLISRVGKSREHPRGTPLFKVCKPRPT